MLGQPAPRFASVNCGVFVCYKCADEHRVLGPDVCTLKSTMMDPWSDRSLQFMQQGGNKKFAEFIAGYGLEKAPVALKYRSRAADYYRKKVHPLDVNSVVGSHG